MNTESSPYIVSSDIQGLMERWSRRTGYQVPPEDHFRGATKDLQLVLEGYFRSGVEVIHEDEIRTGLQKLASNRISRNGEELSLISLDRAYGDENIDIDGHIETTRGVYPSLKPIRGIKPRPTVEGEPNKAVKDQLDSLETKTSKIVLLDDVIFSGSGVIELVDKLRKRGKDVRKVIAGIGIRFLGDDPGGVTRLRNLDIEVECVREFDSVIDEVCQRDFIAGTPMSGRTVFINDQKLRSAPYFLPFGDPHQWASIPNDKVSEFSAFCMDTSIALFKKIEQRSQASVPTSAIDRLPRGLRPNGSFVNALQETKEAVR